MVWVFLVWYMGCGESHDWFCGFSLVENAPQMAQFDKGTTSSVGWCLKNKQKCGSIIYWEHISLWMMSQSCDHIYL